MERVTAASKLLIDVPYDYHSAVFSAEGHDVFFVRREANVLNANFVQFMAQYLTPLVEIPNNEMSTEAHVIDLTGSYKPAGR